MADRFKNRLRDERLARDLTQAKLAEAVGVSRKTINTIENDIFIPSTIIALKIARALDLKVEDIFYFEDASDT